MDIAVPVMMNINTKAHELSTLRIGYLITENDLFSLLVNKTDLLKLAPPAAIFPLLQKGRSVLFLFIHDNRMLAKRAFYCLIYGISVMRRFVHP